MHTKGEWVIGVSLGLNPERRLPKMALVTGSVLLLAACVSVICCSSSPEPIELRTLRGHNGDVTCLAFSPDGTTLATGSSDCSIKLRDVETGNERATLRGFPASIRALAYSQDGKTLAAGTSYLGGATDNRIDPGVVEIWDASGQQSVARFDAPGSMSAVTVVAFSPDGKQLAMVYHQMLPVPQKWQVRVLTADRGKLVAIVEERKHEDRIESVLWSPDGKTLISASQNTMRFWDTTTWQEANVVKSPQHSLTCMAITRDGKTVAAGGGWNLQLSLFDAETRQHIASWGEAKRWASAVAFSSDGQILASAERGQICLWDVQRRRTLGTFQAHSNSAALGINALAFAPRGYLLASASGDKTVKLWDTNEFLKDRPNSK